DGWFGKRNSDRAGLGDWYVSPQKFPNGLKPLIDHVNGLGMDFGLWVEPEMVNPDSDLYRKHPDWVLNFPSRPRSELRNQLVLNLARPEVKEYVFNFLDKLASDYHIKYFKWDMNRSFSEPGWPEVAAPDQKKVWVEYVRNLYDIMDRLRAKHRELVIEEGALGIGANLNRWSQEDMTFAAKMIALYKQIRPTIQDGNLYRLRSPRTDGLAANQYVSADAKQSVLFVFRHSQQFNTPAPTLLLRGLEPGARYRITCIDGKLREKQPELTGAYLMSSGIHVNLRNDYDSTAVVLDRLE